MLASIMENQAGKNVYNEAESWLFGVGRDSLHILPRVTYIPQTRCST